jgi:pyruvate,water dikinase
MSTSTPVGGHVSRAYPASVLHCTSAPGTAWTTTNTGEALPGIVSPLGWTFWDGQMELAFRQAFADIGVLARGETGVPEGVDERSGAVFFGRYTGNVDTVRRFADRMPGTSGDAFEETVFGVKRRSVTSRPSRKRYPVIAVRMLLAVLRQPRQLAAMREESKRWWSASVAAPPRSEAEATRLLAQAATQFGQAMRTHVIATFLCQGLYDRVRALAEAAGKPGLELRLTTGYGGLEEAAVVRDLWEVSRSRLELDEFLVRHGYHGPNEGDLSNPAWRENPELLKTVIERYAARGEDAAPAVVERRQSAERLRAESELLEATGALETPQARIVLRMAARHIPLREVGKASFLRAIDVGRLAARVLGIHLHARGVIADPADVNFLTLAELTGELPADARQLVSQRRAERDGYRAVRLPSRWVGQPEPLPADPASAADAAVVIGVPVSSGVVEGPAHVALDPDELDGFDDGDILVCRLTDPSWAPVLHLAGALVIDIGGPVSHGAIVARELGIPAVINTGNGTGVVRTGDWVRVDASAGRVEILRRESAGLR